MKAVSNILPIIKRELRRITSRPLYLFGMVLAPLFTLAFFISLMGSGLPEDLPVAIVDNDNSAVSRRLMRQLDAFRQTHTMMRCADFHEARKAMQEGKVYAVFYIPKNMEKDVLSNRQPKVSFYLNNSYLIAGSLLYRDLRTISVLGSAAVAKEFRVARGQSEKQAMIDLQPIIIDTHSIGNPLCNYAVYLCNMIVPGVFNILIMLLTIYAIGSELKTNTAASLLDKADGRILPCLFAKLLPHVVIYFIVFTCIDVIFYKYLQFPCNKGLFAMLADSYMLVLASMSLSVFIFGLFPVMRFALSIGSIVSVVSISLSGFSFPVTEMHYMLKAWAAVLPLRHFFLIYVDQALNGLGLIYTWKSYLALSVFLLLPLFVMPRLYRIYKTYKYEP